VAVRKRRISPAANGDGRKSAWSKWDKAGNSVRRAAHSFQYLTRNSCRPYFSLRLSASSRCKHNNIYFHILLRSIWLRIRRRASAVPSHWKRTDELRGWRIKCSSVLSSPGIRGAGAAPNFGNSESSIQVTTLTSSACICIILTTRICRFSCFSGSINGYHNIIIYIVWHHCGPHKRIARIASYMRYRCCRSCYTGPWLS